MKALSSQSLRTVMRMAGDTPMKVSDVSANLVKSLELFDKDGTQKKLGSLMGDDKSVVVFLRHLG